MKTKFEANAKIKELTEVHHLYFCLLFFSSLYVLDIVGPNVLSLTYYFNLFAPVDKYIRIL